MEVAKLVLEFVRVLAWPVVAVAALWIFGPNLRTVLGRLTEASWGGAAVKFAAEVKELGEEAESVRDVHAPKPDSTLTNPTAGSEHDSRSPAPNPATEDRSHESGPAVSGGLPEEQILRMASALQELLNEPDFDAARELATTSPDAAVLLAFRELEGLARAALTVMNLGVPPTTHGSRLVREASPPDARSLAMDLSRLRNLAAHRRGRSAEFESGARGYVDACANLGIAITGYALSRARHPSRSYALEAIAKLDMDDVLSFHPGN